MGFARLQNAHASKERGGGEAVIEHLEERAAERGGRGGTGGDIAAGSVRDGEQREEAVAEVVDGRVGDHALEVGLLHGSEGAEDHAAEGEGAEPRRGVVQRGGKDRPENPQKTVDAHLRHDTGKEHRSTGRGFGVGSGEPRMEGPQRHLDGEAEENAEENNLMAATGEFRGERAIAAQLGELGEIKRAGGDKEGGETDEHKRAAADRVDNKLIRGARRTGTAPELDQEKRGDEAEFPEEEPVKKIEGEEDAEGGTLEEQEERAEEARGGRRREGERERGGEVVPGGEEGGGGENAREEDEEEAQAVEAEVIVDVEGHDPRVALDELGREGMGIKLGEEEAGERERGEREGEREGARGGGADATKEREDGGADPRSEYNEGEERDGVHATPPHIATSARTTKPTARKRR